MTESGTPIRRATVSVDVGGVLVGSAHPVVVQSMTNTDTADADATAIQVARLAGLPPTIIARAKEILSNLEQHELNAEGKPALAEAPPPQQHGKPRGRKRAEQARAGMKPQMTLF